MEISDDTGFSDLARIIPVFPLSGVLMLPGGNLPLHMFEPRYREMVRDSIAMTRLIGMIQPRETDRESPIGEPDLYNIGCVGKITSFRETDDGRYYLTLRGICRFDYVEEVPNDKLYRTALVSYAKFRADTQPVDDEKVLDRDSFLASLRSFFDRHSIDVEWETLAKVPDVPLVRSFAMTCPFEPSEKQAILEASSVAERARMVMSLIEMALAQPGDSRTIQ